MHRFLIFIPLIYAFQTLDDQLVSRWKLIWDDGSPIEEELELNLKKDHTFERLKHGKVIEGKWKAITGKKKTLVEFVFNENGSHVFFEILFSGDTLFLENEAENSVFLKID